MATLNTKNFATLVGQWATVAQSSIAAVRPTLLLSTSKGSILRALAEAQGSVSLWLQGLILKVLTATRLATSQGIDVDSFIADFGVTRLTAAPATGLVTFSRVTPTNPANVPVGALVQTSDGSQTYTVVANTTFAAFNPTLNAYVIPAAVVSGIFPVQAVVAGAAGNVQANSVTILQTGISGVDTVVNDTAFINGFDSESDAAVRVRFVAFINSLSKGTDDALTFAIQSVQQSMQVQIFNNQDPNGTSDFGAVTIFVDDGSGAIPAATLSAANDAVQPVRAASIRVSVIAATILFAFPVMTIVTAQGYDHNTVVAQVVAAIELYINGLGLGNTLSYMRLAQVAFDTSPGVVDVVSYTLNATIADLVPAPGQTIKTTSVIVS